MTLFNGGKPELVSILNVPSSLAKCPVRLLSPLPRGRGGGGGESNRTGHLASEDVNVLKDLFLGVSFTKVKSFKIACYMYSYNHLFRICCPA